MTSTRGTKRVGPGNAGQAQAGQAHAGKAYAGRALSDAARDTLLLGVEPEAPGAATAARILRRVRARLRDSQSIVSVRRDAGWVPFFPGAERKVVFDDGIATSWLLRLKPGATLPQHEHAGGPEECLVLEGDIEHDGERFGPGDYVVALPGSLHRASHTRGGVLMFLRTPSTRCAAD